MTLGVRRKAFLITLGLVVGVGLASGILLEERLRFWLESRIEQEMLELARVSRDLVEVAPRLDSVSAADSLADRLGRSTEARVTIVRSDGVVLGDSELDRPGIERVESHANRREVADALRKGYGISRRYSTTLRVEMLYVAVAYERPGGARGVVRLALPLTEVASTVSRLRLTVAAAGLLGLALAVVASLIAAHLMTRELRDVVVRARGLVRGQGGRRIALDSTDELGRLASTFNELAAELDSTVASLAGERDRLGTILEGMTEAVIALDREGRIALINRASLDVLSLTAAPTGKSLLEAVRLADLEEMARRALGGEVASAELEIGASPRRTLLVRTAPLRSTGGAVAVMHDVTETRRLEVVRRDFVANVSHELRTPLSIIRANAETLLDSAIDDPAHARPLLEALLRNAERVSRLVDDLLDLSRIEAGKQKLEVTPIALPAALDRAVEAFGQQAEQKRQTIVVACDANLECLADPAGLEQVLRNLIDNAVRHTAAGTRIEVAAARRDDHVRIEVRDDGPGVEPRHRDRIFERFYRVDPGRSRELGGTGLGLSIARHVAEAMGGAIGFEPAEPHGSVFFVTLRAAPPA